MTEKLYYKDQYMKEFTAKVLSCEEYKKYFKVVLDRTAFFPEGGGQPGDRGFIENSAVLDTQIENDVIYHICDKEVSGEVNCRLDWNFRFDNMQQHSGEQILTAVIHNAKGYENVGFHIGEEEVTVDFDGPLTKQELDELETKANEAIYENMPIDILWPTSEELKNYDYRSKKELTGQVRLVKIGNIDLCACCGTHITKTGEAGIVKVISCENYKGGVRLHIKCGLRALRDFREKNDNTHNVASQLWVKPNEIVSAVEELKKKNADEKYAFNALKTKYFSLLCENVTENLPAVFIDSGNTEDARILADILSEKIKIAYAFSGDDENGYKYAIISKSEDVRPYGKAINETLRGRGGGKPEVVMGSLNCKKIDIMGFFQKTLDI